MDELKKESRQLEKLSPFEIKDKLIDLAKVVVIRIGLQQHPEKHFLHLDNSL